MSTTEDSPVAIVTGAASGIGRGITKLLLSRGYLVAMVDWNTAQGEEESKKLGPRTIFIQSDVSDWDSISSAFKTTKQKWGRIDLHAANAGIGEPRPLIFETSDGAEPTKPVTTVLNVNLLGAVYGVNLALFYMRRNEKKGGKIIVTASTLGIYPFPAGPLYSASKHGCVGLVRSMADKLQEEDIFLNALCPSLTDSGITNPLIHLFPKGIVTPMAHHVEAYNRFLDSNMFGAIMESSADGLYIRKAPEYWAEGQKWMDSDETKQIWDTGLLKA